MRLKGKVALITGSSAGIGAGIAKGMAAEGADIIVNYCNDKNGAEKTARAIREVGRKTLVVRADVGKSQDVDELFRQIRGSFGRLDLLVNNAGITTKKAFEQTDEADWDRILNTNLKSVFLCCKQTIALMPPGGSILNISSIHARTTTCNFSAYAASKGGMESLTRNLAIELAEKKIRVNALRVGFVVVEREPLWPDDPSYELICARIPLQRPGQVADIVPTAIHLCSDDAGFITGQVLGVDGGAGIMLNSPYPKGFVEGGANKQ